VGSKSLAMICLVASLTMGCEYLERPKGFTIPASLGDHLGIAFGGQEGFLSATLSKPQTECFSYKEFVKVGDTTKQVWRYKIVVTAQVNAAMKNREAWPFASPKGTVRVEIRSPKPVILASQDVEHTFILDVETSLVTASFYGLTEDEVERIHHVELNWHYSR